ncbi:hypothetical protein [Streptomyces griseus]|uniref:hypothetical protein n=1 Tax=Streptomyces griseus TaxID=1911 RepID=UPI0036878643
MPLAEELTSSLIRRAADRFGLPAAGVLRLWTCRNSPARNDGGGVRADAEIVLNEAGRAVLAESQIFGAGGYLAGRVALFTFSSSVCRPVWEAVGDLSLRRCGREMTALRTFGA